MAEFVFAGLTRKGKTVQEARRSLDRDITSMLEGSYAPTLILFEGYTCIMWREPQSGWSYRVFAPGEKHDGLVSCIVSASWNREDCERAARKHMAQWLYNGTRTGEEVIKHEGDRRDHLSWVNWQNRYKEAKDQGKTDQEARDYANRR